MSCKISPETLTALHEHALPWWQVLALAQHTRRCSRCQATLTSFDKLDIPLRALAPIPAEIPHSFLQKHRRVLMGSGFALAALGLGTWHFFTPEITWDNVEEAMGQVKSAQWHRSICFYPREEPAPDLLSGVLSLVDPALHSSASLVEEGIEFHRTYPKLHGNSFAGSVPLSLERLDQILTTRTYNGFAPLYKHEYGTSGLSSSVRLWHNKRVIAFTFHYAGFNTGIYWRLPQCEDTILVNPQTCRVLERQRVYREVTGRIGCCEKSEDIRYDVILPEPRTTAAATDQS